MDSTQNHSANILNDLIQSFQLSLLFQKSLEARNFIERLGLDFNKLEIGYNSGQFHHRKTLQFKQQFESIGILTKSNAAVNKKDLVAYTCFGANGIVFPLKDEMGNVVNFYAIRFKLDSKPQVFLNGKGLYPSYPNKLTKRLFITLNIIDATSLIQSKVMNNHETVLSLFNGIIKSQLIETIKELKDLKEIILINSGINAIKQQLAESIEAIAITEIMLPNGKSLNEVFLNYGSDGLMVWLNDEIKNQRLAQQPHYEKLTIQNSNKITYLGIAALYEVVGQLPSDYGNMKVCLNIIDLESQHKQRIKLDLFDASAIESNLNRMVIKNGSINISLIETDLAKLTDLLELHREKMFNDESKSRYNESIYIETTPTAEKNAVEFLKKPELLKKIDNLLEQSGIMGNLTTRIPVFIVASTYKMPHTLHSLIQGDNGSGKSYLINAIAQCVPQEDVINLTHIARKSLYYHNKNELQHKLIIIQNIDSLNDDVKFAFHKMQSNGYLCSSITEKDRYGTLRSQTKQVNAHFSSISATSNASKYFDFMDSTIIIAVDECQELTDKIIQYQNQKQCGIIEEYKEQQAQQSLRQIIRMLKPFDVINPYADKLLIPMSISSRRGFNQQFQHYINQITILHQYQRKLDNKGRLISSIDDVKAAIETLFPTIWFSIDEIDNSTRHFFERLKVWVKQQAAGKHAQFSTSDVRLGLNLSKTRIHEYFKVLKDLDYIRIAAGSANRGYKFQICYWDDLEKLKAKIHDEMLCQLEENKYHLEH